MARLLDSVGQDQKARPGPNPSPNASPTRACSEASWMLGGGVSECMDVDDGSKLDLNIDEDVPKCATPAKTHRLYGLTLPEIVSDSCRLQKSASTSESINADGNDDEATCVSVVVLGKRPDTKTKCRCSWSTPVWYLRIPAIFCTTRLNT